MRGLSIAYIWERIQSAHPRTRKAQLNSIYGVIIKGGGMFISLLLVPMTIDYLSTSTYGTWLTISSVVTMLVFFDIGIGNGLRNKLSEAVSNQNIPLARSYISTAYLLFGSLQASFIIIFLFIFRLVPWQSVLNSTIDDLQLQSIILITIVAIAVKLVLDILSYILLAIQESGKIGLINFTSNLFILIGTYLLTQFSKGNLVYLAVVTAFSPVAVLLVSSFFLYRKRLKDFRPSIIFADVKHAKGLLSLGYKFFVIQIAVVVLFYTDNLIVTQLFGPSEVTKYNIAFRYFNAISTIFLIVITPYWSAFTEASVKKDNGWMKKTYGYLSKVWLALLIITVIMGFFASPIYNLWIGDRVKVPTILNITMGISTLIICWNNVTVAVINGLGKIKLQLICSVFAATVNIPLSFFLGQELGLGSAGVIIATCLSLLPSSITGTIQAKKLINGNARGIWAS